MTQPTTRPTRRPWLKWLGITVGVLVALYAIAVLLIVASFSGSFM